MIASRFLTAVTCVTLLMSGFMMGRLTITTQPSVLNFGFSFQSILGTEKTLRPPGYQLPGGLEAAYQSPKAALREDRGFQRRVSFLSIASTIPIDQLAALFDGARQDPLAVTTIVEVWARRDPQSLLTKLMSAYSNLDIKMFHILMSKWSAQDPKEANDAREQLTGIWRILSAYGWHDRMQKEPLKTIEEAARLGDPDGIGYTDKHVAPFQAMEMAEMLQDHRMVSDTSLVTNTLSKAFAEQDPRAGLDWAAKQAAPEILTSYLEDLLPHYYRKSPGEALQYAQALNPLRRGAALAAIGATMAEEDPTSAMLWTEENVPEVDFEGAMNQVLVHMGKEDPLLALRQYDRYEMTHSFERGELIKSLLDTDPVAASAYLAQRPPASLLQSGLFVTNLFDSNSVASKWAKADLPAAADYAGRSSTNDRDIAHSVAKVWRDRDNWVEGLAWAQELPENLRAQAESPFTERWLREDFEAAEKSILGREGTLRSQGMEQAFSHLLKESSQQSFDWILTHGTNEEIENAKSIVQRLNIAPSTKRTYLEKLGREPN